MDQIVNPLNTMERSKGTGKVIPGLN